MSARPVFIKILRYDSDTMYLSDADHYAEKLSNCHRLMQRIYI